MHADIYIYIYYYEKLVQIFLKLINYVNDAGARLQLTEQGAGDQAGAQHIGVCYGTNAYNQPSPQEAVSLVQSLGIKRMRLYSPDHNVLQSLRNSGIEVVLGIPEEQLEWVASSQDNANQWIQDNVKNYQDISFRYIVVGKATDYSAPQALQNIQNAVSACGLENKPKVTTVMDQSYDLGLSYPPSNGMFRDTSKNLFGPVISFLVNNSSPFLVDLNPFGSYLKEDISDDIPDELRLQGIHSARDARLDYAAFISQETKVQDGPLTYTNVFDAKVDSVYSALEKLGGSSLDVVVSQTGWPTAGRDGANIENAWNHNNGLINHVLKSGTPKRPQKFVETYIYNLFDETSKTYEVDKHWGIFWNSKQPKYLINFQTQ